MICKEDVVSWFKELESFKRIDTMCTLLNMCLPFELRFLGTCLEELGRRDSQELRGIELRVNNPQELAADIASCQSGEPTDMKIRRKMALYLALIRACNRSCVNELFKTLDGWGERDFFKINDIDTLQELLLVYTMATNHPVFSFEQRMKCGEIYLKLKEIKESKSGHSHHSSLHQDQPPIHIHGGHPPIQTPIQVIPQGNIPMGFPQAPITQMIPADASLSHQIAVDGIHHMLPSNMAIPSEFPVGPPNALAWTLRPNLSYPPPSLEQHPPQSSSPMLSQPSSPCHSRTTSPSRSSSGLIQQTQQVRNPQQRGVTLRNSRRPSAETTPPPVQQQQQQHQQLIGLIGNSEMILPQNPKHLDDLDESQIEGRKMMLGYHLANVPVAFITSCTHPTKKVVVNVDGTMTQLQTLCRNGYTTRSGHHTLPRQSKSSAHLHHSQQQHHNQHLQAIASNIIGGPTPIQPATNFNAANLAYTLQNMSLIDVHNPLENNILASNRHKSGGSDSGSSIGSVGEVTPPDTPSIVGNNSSTVRLNDQNNYSKQINMPRINGRPDKLGALCNLVGSGGGAGGGTTVIYAPATNSPQQQFVGNEIILSAGGNIMPTQVSNNNNNSLSSTGSGSSSNNNLVTSTVLITAPSTITGGGVSNVISTNPVILQQHQSQQFSATYPYHAQHLATTTRPPILSHNPTIAPPPGTFRHHGFQIQPNGDILYPYPPQVAAAAGLTFMPPPSAVPPPPPTAVVRSSPSAVSPAAAPQQTQPLPQPQQQPPQQLPQLQQPPPQMQQPPPQLQQPPPQLQQPPPQLQQPPPQLQQPPPQLQQPPPQLQQASLQLQQPPPQLQQTPSQPPNVLLAGSPYTTLTEASMEDVTRSSIYKLDYTTAAVSPGSNTVIIPGSSSNPSSGGGGGSGGGGNISTVEIATETSSSTSSTSSLSNSNAK